MENTDNYKKNKKFVSKFKQNDRENVTCKTHNKCIKFFSHLIFDITVLFMLRHVPYVQYSTSFYLETNGLSNQHMYGLFK
jgi:hypothetical protein